MKIKNRMLFTALSILLICGCGGGGQQSSNNTNSSSSIKSSVATSSSSSTSSASSSITSTEILSWWHDKFDANATAAVADDKVRRSTIYDVKISTVSDQANEQNSFVYMTIPRGGKVKQNYTSDDGAEFSSSAKQTMSWTSFLYKSDVWIQVELKDGKTINSIDELIVRPTTLQLQKELLSPTSVRIKVPFNENGFRFSVEFNPELMSAHSTQLGVSGGLSENPKDALVHVEPRNSLMIFAEPMLSGLQQAAMVPSDTAGTIFYPAEGNITLNNVTQQIIYFKPGIYSMASNYHAKLPANVKWVYLAPGAYVKGAFEFGSTNSDYKLTGYGVLSGEKYVYAADKNANYAHSAGNCDANCLRLLQFGSSGATQTLSVQGITLNEPPFNSFVVFGNTDTYKTDVSHYKQVGSWYYQTDGVEIYTGGSVKHAFFHSNDDVIKIYHSNTVAEDVVIWKGENGPAIQFGWASRNISNIQVKDINVIHNRMYWKDQKSNTCIINSTDLYSETPLEQDKISLSHTIKNIEFQNIRSEGKNLCAMRFIALSNWESIHVNGLEIDDWNDLATDSQLNLFHARSTSGSNPQQVSIGAGDLGLKIENYKVKGKSILKSDDSWKSNSNGRLNFDSNLWSNWTAIGSEAPNCTAQTINFSALSDANISSQISLAVTASSGLPVTYKILGGDATIINNLLTTSTSSGLITVAAEAGDNTYCDTQVVRLLNVIDTSAKPLDGRWIGASWSSWSPGNIPMTWDDNAKLFKATVTLSVGVQQLKFTNSNNWSADDWGAADGLSGVATKTTGGGGNINFTISIAGSYTITFNPYSLAYSIIKN